MKSFKMKALAVAVFGLAGLGMAGSAFAVCPTLGAQSNSQANVKDTSPQAQAPLTGEGRYRSRFYLGLANLTAFTVSNQTAVVFRANSATGPAQFTSDQLVVKIAGGATPTVRFFVSDLNPVSGVTQVAVPLPASATSTYRIEFDMQVGTGATTVNGCTAMPATGGCLRYWVTDAAGASTDAAPYRFDHCKQWHGRSRQSWMGRREDCDSGNAVWIASVSYESRRYSAVVRRI